MKPSSKSAGKAGDILRWLAERALLEILTLDERLAGAAQKEGFALIDIATG